MDIKDSILRMLLLGWVLPVAAMVFLMIYVVDAKERVAVNETVENSVENVVDLIDLRIDESVVSSKNASYYTTIREAYTDFLKDGKTNSLVNEVTSFLGAQYKFNNRFDTAILVFTDSAVAPIYVYNNSNGATYKDVDAFFKTSKDTILKLSDDLGTDTRIYTSGDRLYLVRNLVMPDFSPYAVLVLELDKTELFDGLNSVWGFAGGTVSIASDRIFTCEAEEEVSKSLESVTTSLKKLNVTFDFDLSLDKKVIYQRTRAAWNIFFVIVGLLLPVVITIFIFFKKNVSEKIYKEEIALRDARIMALQSQINPHFLNNTLEIINWEARLNGNDKVSSMIEALSTMLEATMNRKESRIGTITDELSYVDAYMYITSMRLGSGFSFEKDIDESLLPVQIPRLIIQPLVENAVEHGVKIRGFGKVILRLYEKNDYIIIEVENDTSLSKEDQDSIDTLLNTDSDITGEIRVSLGIRNINRRLKLTYGNDCGLTITGTEAETTLSRVLLHKEIRRGQ